MRRALLFLTVGVCVGIAAGLIIGWAVLPVQVVESPMRDLSRRYRDDYTVMVAAAFLADRDVNEAIWRLAPLQIDNAATYIRDAAERYISQQGTGLEADIRALVELSCALGYCTPPMQPFRLPPGP